MNWIENQPVFFGENDSCSDDEIMAQIVDNTDKTQFQFEISKCDDAVQILENPTFDSETGYMLGGNWAISDNTLCHTAGVTGSVFSTISFSDITKYYEVILTVESISGGSLFAYLGGTLLGEITSTGVYTFYGFPSESLGTYYLTLTPDDNTDVCLSELSIYEVLLNAIVAVYDNDDNYVGQINYTDDTEKFIVSKNTMTITVDWAELGLSNNCYYLCLLDPCENTNGQNYPPLIENCTFDGNADGWALDGTANYSSGTAIINDDAPGSISQEEVFPNLHSIFCILIDVTAVVGSVNVYFGSNLVYTIDEPGFQIVSGTPTGDYSLTIETEGTGNAIIINSVCPCELGSYSCNFTSNTFKLSDLSSSCTLLLNACNNEDGMGFVFEGSGFIPRVRVEAKLRQAKYASERTVYENSIGKKSNVYFSGRKSKNLCIDLQPEYIHDFLRLLLGFDNVYIEGELYSVDDDEYNVEYNEVSDNVGKVRLLVSKRTQNVKNINCSDDESVCNLGESILLQSDDLSQHILLTDGESILING